jgi:hypothetical protein
VTGLNVFQWLQVAGIGLRVAAGGFGALTPADLATLEGIGKSLITKENEEAVWAFLQKYGPDVWIVVNDGVLLLRHLNSTDMVEVGPAVLVDANGTPISGVGPLPDSWPEGG